jgi:Kef-type K+ transport system membrane component KefB
MPHISFVNRVLGLAFLLCLAGLEIDLTALRGRALRVAGLGYGLTLLLGLAVGPVRLHLQLTCGFRQSSARRDLEAGRI